MKIKSNINMLMFVFIVILVFSGLIYLRYENLKEFVNLFNSLVGAAFGSWIAFYFNILNAKEEIRENNITALKKADFVLNKYLANNELIKEYIDACYSDGSNQNVNEWEKIQIFDNKFPIIEIDIHSLLFLVDYQKKCGMYLFKNLKSAKRDAATVIKGELAYIVTLKEGMFFFDKSKGKFYEIVVNEKRLNNLLKKLNLLELSNFKPPLCLFEELNYDQQQNIILNTGYAPNLLDNILLAHSEYEESIRILGERNIKYINYFEKKNDLKEVIQENLYNELKTLTKRLVESNKNVILDCSKASIKINEFLEQYKQ